MGAVQLITINETQHVIMTVEELLQRELEASIKGGEIALQQFTAKQNTKIIEFPSDEWLTTEEAMKHLGIKSTKGFISYRKKHYKTIKKERTGKGNMYLKSSLIKIKQ